MRKVISVFIIVLSFVLIFGGCTPVEEYISQPPLKYDTVYPKTATEYNLAINKKIVPFLNTMEGHIAKSKDIINGNYPIQNEINSLNDTVDYLQELYDDCTRIYPPKECQDRHSDILKQMERALNSVKVHQETLQNDASLTPSQQEEISTSAKIMQSEFTSLKNMFNIN